MLPCDGVGDETSTLIGTVLYTIPQVENVHWYLKFSKLDVVGLEASLCFLGKVNKVSSVLCSKEDTSIVDQNLNFLDPDPIF